jgi:hypothetical protein
VHVSPVIGHPTCDLALQRRIREAQRERTVRAVVRARSPRSWLDRLLRRRAREPNADLVLDAESLVDRGEDVWKALRF